jgi:hypothetical protein
MRGLKMNKLKIISLLVLVICCCLSAQAEELLLMELGTPLQTVKKLHPTLVEFPSWHSSFKENGKQIRLIEYSEPIKDIQSNVYVFRSTNNGPFKYSFLTIVSKANFNDAKKSCIKAFGEPLCDDGTSLLWTNYILTRVQDTVQLKAGYRSYIMLTKEVSKCQN